MAGLGLIIAKDLRLLWRDRAGLVFLGLAPIVVITVAGLSLANLYGSDPTGQSAYELPLVDEDGGALARDIAARLAAEPALRVEPVGSREEAERWVRDRKRAGTALVIPRGFEAALRAGEPASLVLYTDAVKYLERLNVRLRLAQIRDALGAEQRAAAQREAAEKREALRAQLDRLQAALRDARAALDATWSEAIRARERAVDAVRHDVQSARRTAQARIARELAASRASLAAALGSEVAALRAPLRSYLDLVAQRRAELQAWLAALERKAGSHAGEIPPPPAFPELPPELARFVAEGAAPELPPLPALALDVEAPRIELPPLPAPPALALPELALPDLPAPPGELRIQEIDVSGAGATLNTFDQNVPGFSVTFLLLGMLLGVSMGLLDERDWGTFERLRSLPVGLGSVLAGKLTARFAVGVAQMLLLFAVGRVAFGVSLGPQPWALLLPIAGIAFAGAAFGLVVAAIAPGRESVLPVGSAVVVSMAAMGGCWWPIDLEPRWMRRVALAFPTTWAMDAFNDLMIRRRSASIALLPSLVMAAYGALYLAAGLALFRWRLERARS